MKPNSLHAHRRLAFGLVLLTAFCFLLSAFAQTTNAPGVVTYPLANSNTNPPGVVTFPLTVWDTDVASFVGRGSISNLAQQAAVIAFVNTAKAPTTNFPGGFWTNFACIYPFVGGNDTAHAQNLKANAHNITWHGTVTHSSSGITGNASDGWGDTTFNLSTGGTYTESSATLLVYCGTASPTDGGYFIAADHYSATCLASLWRASGNLTFAGLNSTTASESNATSDFRGPLGITKRDSTHVAVIKTGSIYAEGSDTGTCLPDVSVGLLTENRVVGPTAFSNANLRFAIIGGGMTSAQTAEVVAAIETFQAALSRTAP